MKNPFSSSGRRERSSQANERGRELDDQGRRAEAIREYERACRLDPGWSIPFYNLGLVYKYAGDWERSLVNNQRATELSPDDQGSWWNLGIAATALGRWDVARAAWRGAGIAIPEGEGPIDYPCGFNPIRLNPTTEPEVVWADRLDPARALLRSIPFPESGFRWADVVLNDGAPVGYRRLGEDEVPVFDGLELLQASPFSTWLAEVELEAAGDSAAIDLLAELAAERSMAAEDWSTHVRFLCRACSEGRPHEEHEHGPAEVTGPHKVALAAREEQQAEDLLEEWEARSGKKVLTLGIVLDADAI